MSDRVRYDENQELRAKVKQLEEEDIQNTIYKKQLKERIKTDFATIKKQQKVIDEIKKLLKSKQIIFKDKRVGFTHISETELKEILAQLEKKA